MSARKNKVTMKDVARYAGAAIGTVDRVLNSTGYVSDKKKEVILKAIKELNYIPDKVASALSRQKATNIAVVYPNVEKYFWEQIENGIKKAENQFEAYGLKVIRSYINSYDIEEQEKAVQQLIKNHEIQGLAIVPVHPSKLNPLINRLVDNGTPAVTFDSDAPSSKRMCFVGEDNVKGGSIAGKLMTLFLGGRGKVAVLRGQRDMLAIQQRISGFIEKITNEFPDIEIARFYDMYDNRENYEKNIKDIVAQIIDSNKILNKAKASNSDKAANSDDAANSNGTSDRVESSLSVDGEINGIFVTNALVNIVGEAIRNSGNPGNIKLIGFDYSDEIDSLIREDVISATICTDLEFEGYEAIKLLFEAIREDRKPQSEYIITKYDIKMKETL